MSHSKQNTKKINLILKKELYNISIIERTAAVIDSDVLHALNSRLQTEKITYIPAVILSSGSSNIRYLTSAPKRERLDRSEFTYIQ